MPRRERDSPRPCLAVPGRTERRLFKCQHRDRQWQCRDLHLPEPASCGEGEINERMKTLAVAELTSRGRGEESWRDSLGWSGYLRLVSLSMEDAEGTPRRR